VVSSDATRADALSTAVSVLGSNRGIQLAEEIPGTEALFKWVEGDRVRRAETKGFKALLMP
jgi:thiamine biosynthesis lipoprotein ApbE